MASTKIQLANARSALSAMRKESKEALPRTLAGAPAVVAGGVVAGLLKGKSLDLGPLSLSYETIGGLSGVIAELAGAGEGGYVARGLISMCAGLGACAAKDLTSGLGSIFGGDE